jgi:phosphonate transport system substrate-binding protein
MDTRLLFSIGFVILFTLGCDLKKAPLGSPENPVKLHFVPSVEAKVLKDRSKDFKAYLEKNTPYHYTITIPQSYITVVEAFGTNRADVSALNSFGYVLANERYGAEAKLTMVRHGSPTFKSQFLARADSRIQKLEDLNGKSVAFVDPASTSGYLLPLKTLKDRNIHPKETVFAMKHDSVISMIYQKQVDAGATFYSPPQGDRLEDARRLVLSQYPDVAEKIKIVELSEPIPNEPFVFRKEMPEEMKNQIVEALLKYVETPDGAKAFKDLYGVTALRKANDSDYDVLRKMILESRKKLKPAKTL